MENLPGSKVCAVGAQVLCGTAVKAVPVYDEIGRSASDINRRHSKGPVIRAVGARLRGDEEIGIALVVLDYLIVQIHDLPADRLIPVYYDIREERPVFLPALLGREIDVAGIFRDPAHALPDKAYGLSHAAAVNVNLLLRH